MNSSNLENTWISLYNAFKGRLWENLEKLDEVCAKLNAVLAEQKFIKNSLTSLHLEGKGIKVELKDLNKQITNLKSFNGRINDLIDTE